MINDIDTKLFYEIREICENNKKMWNNILLFKSLMD